MPDTATKPLATPRLVRVRAAPAAKPRAAAKPQPLVLSVVDIIDSKFCVTNDDAKKVFNHLHRAFKKKQPVEVSFHGTDMVTLPFVELAIGKLYEKYPEKEIRPLVKVTGLENGDEFYLKHAVREGKKYFADPKGYTAYMKKAYKELCDAGLYD